MFKWIIAVILLLSVVAMGYLYMKASNYSGGDTAPVTVNLNPKPIAIIDAYKDGIHRFSGTVRLPHSCFRMSTSATHEGTDLSVVNINLVSVDNFNSSLTSCVRYPTQYPFETIIESPEQITIHLFLDGNELQTTGRQTDWQNPSGNVINTPPAL